MKIKKLGHCCLVIEINGKRIMTDPGSFSTLQNEEKNIDVILFTHEHYDHLHLESLKKVLENNPKALIITNTAVGKILDAERIKYTKVEDGENFEISGIKITGFGEKHAEIYGDYGQVQNTGYTIDNFCYPGDSFSLPKSKPDILALPVTGPWMKLREAIDYAKQLNPKITFPVHDGTLNHFAAFIPRVLEHFLSEAKIDFKVLEIGKAENL